MKKTILITLAILAYFFAISCEDVVNSDDNVFKNPKNIGSELGYKLCFSRIKKGYQIVKYDIIKEEREIWKEDAQFLNKSIDNILLYYTIGEDWNKFKYYIYDFNKNHKKSLFNGDFVKEYYRLIKQSKLIESKSLTYSYISNNTIYLIKDLTNNTKSPVFGIGLNNLRQSTNNKFFAAWNDYYQKPFIYTSNLQSVNNTMNEKTYPYEWINDEEILCFNYDVFLLGSNNDYSITKYNIHTQKIDTILVSDDMKVSHPILSPNKKKIAFTIYPDGLGIMNFDGSNVEILREPGSSGMWDSKLSMNEWSPDGKYILLRRYYGSASSQNYITGLEVINVETGEIQVIEKYNFVTGATWIKE
jgi:hypothetical protein